MSETVEKYMEAVRQNGYALGDVPEERRTEIARQYGLGKEPPKGAA